MVVVLLSLGNDLVQEIASFLDPQNARPFDMLSKSTRLWPNTWCRVLVAQFESKVLAFLNVGIYDIEQLKCLWIGRNQPLNNRNSNLAIHIVYSLIIDDVDGFLGFLRRNWWMWQAVHLKDPPWQWGNGAYFYEYNDDTMWPWRLCFSGRLTMNPIEQLLLNHPPVSFDDEDFNQLQRLVFIGRRNTKKSDIITLQEVLRMTTKGFSVNVNGMPHHIRQSKKIIARAVTYNMI